MAETEQTKVCPLCAETIKAAAKVCPYCRKSQRRWALFTRYDLCAMVAVLLYVGAAILIIFLFQTKRDFGPDREKIRVIETHFAVARDASTTNMVAFGIVTNESEHSWEIGQLEIRYFDRKGKLVGVENEPEDFTIFPKSDHSFHLDLNASGFLHGYATYEVKVVSAGDPRAPFQLFGD
jgi:hypothetical protein